MGLAMSPPRTHLIDSFLGLYGELLRHLRWRTGSAERAQDVMQDTYLRLLESESRQGEGMQVRDSRAFIYRVAGNLAIDAVRREQRSREVGAPDDSVPDAGPGPEQRAQASDRLRRLDEALRELPGNCRLALLMFRVDGLSHAQIARRLGVSQSMVAKYIGRALQHCRSRLDDE